jgi:hypothetical protein
VRERPVSPGHAEPTPGPGANAEPALAASAVDLAGVDRQALLSTLTTEHFTLQGARGSTVSESTARAGLYVGALSSSLVAIGFIAQAAQMGDAFRVFVLVVLPALYLLGLFTLVRVVYSSVEDLHYGRAINRIRNYYLQLAGPAARYFSMVGHDDTSGVLANMAIVRPSRWQLYYTLGTLVAVLNAIVAAAFVAFGAGVLGAPLLVAVVIGAVVGIVSLALSMRWQQEVHVTARDRGTVLFPSSPADR